MKTFKVKQVDTFTTKPFSGNPAGVVVNATGLTSVEMQKIAQEMNLPATTFVFTPHNERADFFVRYFLPRSEVAVGGHPTIATIHALIEEGKIGLDKNYQQIWLETGAGILPVEINGSNEGNYTITMTMATPKFDDAGISHEELAAILGTDRNNLDDQYAIRKMNTGIHWFVVRLKKLAAIRNLHPDLAAIANLSRREKVAGIQVFTTETEDFQCDFHVRTFIPNEGVDEDIVCGTGNSCIAAFIVENEIVKTNGKIRFISEQGIELGRPSRVYIEVEGKPHNITKVKISGTAVTVLTGEIHL